MNDFYVQSTQPGFTFRVYVYKPQGSPAYAAAVEGKMTDMGMFTTRLYADRMIRVPLPGSNSRNNRIRALQSLRDTLVNDELVAPDEPWDFDA